MPITTSRLPAYPGGSEWTLLQTFADAAGGDIVSFDTGVMGTTYDLYKIIGLIQNTNILNILCRINNESGNNYAYLSVAAWTPADTKWQLATLNPADITSQFEYLIRGKTIGALRRPTISGNSSSGSLCLLNGHYDVDIATVNRIQVYTDANATGNMKVFGMNLT